MIVCAIKKYTSRENQEKMNKFFQPTKKISLILIALFLSVLTPNLLAGGVYKWTDENGVIHYSDIKPNNIESKSLKIKAGNPQSSRSSAQDQVNSLKEKETQKLAAQAQQLQDDTYKRENEARCQVLRENLRKFAENSRIKINDNGKLRFLTPEEINNKKKQYQQTLDDNCS